MSISINNLDDLKNVTDEIIKLKFNDDFKESLNGGQLIPPWIKSIEFDYDCEFNESLDFLPERLEKLIFYNRKNHSLKEISNFPKSLKKLSLGILNQELKPDILPPNLKELHLGFYYNQEIKPGILPKTLSSLTFGYEFNQEIKPGVLPENLTSLTFGFDFNQEIKSGILPKNLTFLAFGCDFNQDIKPNVLPENLTSLTFGNHFNQDIKLDTLPVKLKKIIIPGTYPFYPRLYLKKFISWKYTFDIKVR